MKKNAILISTIVVGLVAVTTLSRAIDARRSANNGEFAEESLYVSAPTAKRLTLAFNGLVADWYWMRSLQYVGGKIVAYQDSHEGRMDFDSLASLNLALLPQLLTISTTLDPQFMAPYEYGAMILPEIDSKEAIALLSFGIAQNPSTWRLYHHLGYIYWQRREYGKAGDVYGIGAKLPGAPAWMTAMSARMKGEGDSRNAAREMYQHLYETTSEPGIKAMVEKQLIRLDSLDERDVIRGVLDDFKVKNGRCASAWPEVNETLRASRIDMGSLNGTSVDPVRVYRRFKFEAVTEAPLDPSDTPYQLIKNGCDVGLDVNTKVPLK
ncbi:MAG: hypothetical protein ACXW3C_14670 [Pyrinomonadaceae bacterium]